MPYRVIKERMKPAGKERHACTFFFFLKVQARKQGEKLKRTKESCNNLKKQGEMRTERLFLGHMVGEDGLIRENGN